VRNLLLCLAKIKSACEINNIQRHHVTCYMDENRLVPYLKQGDKTLAIENYKRSLDLNLQNDNAREVLKKLEVPIG
jgi:hypothetical protein